VEYSEKLCSDFCINGENLQLDYKKLRAFKLSKNVQNFSGYKIDLFDWVTNILCDL